MFAYIYHFWGELNCNTRYFFLWNYYGGDSNNNYRSILQCVRILQGKTNNTRIDNRNLDCTEIHVVHFAHIAGNLAIY